MKTCPNCQAQNPDGAEFCSNCGNSLVAAAPPQAPPPGAPYAQPAPYPVMAENNGKAVASLVFGILAWFMCPVIFSVVAIILGYSAKNEIAASGGRQTGESFATIGIILGWLSIAVAVIVGIIIAVVVAVGVSNSVILPVLFL
ncbi:MAG: DUF4190 domain-containing protein [Actinomycetota bacterium]|nr:DUF4190 domain-containing protein [Actinomycetota bacterium]